jgi:S1-C subfamily serine protease
LLAGSSIAGDVERELDEVFERAAPGIVRIDVHRPWSAYGTDSFPVKGISLPVHRIQGSGVVWDSAGHILTVADVAQPGDTLRVWGFDGVERSAVFVAQDPDLELSLIRIDGPSSLHPIPRRPSAPLETRGWVLTIGYNSSGPSRHVSANRIRGRARRSGIWQARLDGIQDPALAGGGALDGDGRLIGLLLGSGNKSLLLSAGERASRVEYCMGSTPSADAGWILPIDGIAAAVESLRTTQRGREGFLGVRTQLPDDREEGTSRTRGVFVAEVIPGSPADHAGIRAGDRLVAWNATELESWPVLTARVMNTRLGEKVRVGLVRNGKPVVADVVMADRGHVIWREKQKRIADSRARKLRRQIQGLRQELELLRHQLAAYR